MAKVSAKHNASYAAILAAADAAGTKAAADYVNAGKLVPMVVGSPSTPFGNDVDYSKRTYFVPDGVCGFAWVKFPKATASFVKWLKANGKGYKSYQGGWELPVHAYNQSMQLKEAHAAAMAAHLRANGVECYSQSRMD